MEYVSPIHFDMLKKLVVTQIVCIILMFTGIVVEYIYEADLGFLAITIGSAIFAITTKFENYYLTKRRDK